MEANGADHTASRKHRPRHPMTLRSLQSGLSRVLIILLTLPSYSAEGKSFRDPKVRAEYVREHPCPAVRERRCQYDLDHVIALECGGRDHASNLAWLNIESHKLKTKYDNLRCKSTWFGRIMRTWRAVRFWE